MIRVKVNPNELRRLGEAMRKKGMEYSLAYRAAIHASGLEVQRIATPITPVDTGRLRGTLRTHRQDKPLRVYVSADTQYAVYVHENERAHHDPPTQAKYLSEALARFRPKMMRFVIAFIRQYVGGSGIR
jgi:hypothetical protein